MKNNHFDYLDLLKGVGIILVVFGHGPFPCHFAIDVFHMPLFFFVAGMTFRCPSIENVGAFFIKKTNRILIPFIFWTILSFFIERIVGKPNPEETFNGPLWFLQTIFVAFAMYVLICRYFKGIKLHITVLFIYIMSTVLYFYPSVADAVPFSLTRAMAALFYLHLGSTLNKNIQQQSKKQTWLMFFIMLIVYVAGILTSMKWFDVEGVSFVSGTVHTYCPPLSILTALAGILLVLSMSKILNKLNPINWLGKNSLVIMCVHFPVIERLNLFFSSQSYYQTSIGRILAVISIYIITFSVSIIITIICKKYIPKLTGYGSLISM